MRYHSLFVMTVLIVSSKLMSMIFENVITVKSDHNFIYLEDMDPIHDLMEALSRSLL